MRPPGSEQFRPGLIARPRVRADREWNEAPDLNKARLWPPHRGQCRCENRRFATEVPGCGFAPAECAASLPLHWTATALIARTLSTRAGKDTRTWPSIWFSGARRFGRYDANPVRRSEKPGKLNLPSDFPIAQHQFRIRS